MIRHQPYFEVLSTLDESSPSWLPTLAGLAVLERVDAIRENLSLARDDWTGAASVSETVSQISERDPRRRQLLSIVQDIAREEIVWRNVTEALFGYGRALDLDGDWKLAVDVFGTVADIARAERYPRLAIEATTALGGSARRSGDWDKSAEGYADAAHLASAVGDKALGLTVRVGTANTMIARGNLQAARQVFDEVVAEAQASRLDSVEALAIHGQASVALLEKNYNGAVTLAYKALEKTTNPNLRDNLTAEIAAAFVELGMRDAGRDANLVLSLTSRYHWVRSQATINLMELASFDGIEDAFDTYAAQLKTAPLDPRLKSYFLLYYGQGCETFGRHDAAVQYITEARDFAISHKIHQVAFEAENALVAVGKSTRLRGSGPQQWDEHASSDVLAVAEAFARLRDTAVASPRTDEWL